MTEKEYRAHPAISRSELWRIRESPEKFKYYREHPPEPTPALVFGQLFHKMALQPESVWDEFALAPDVDRRTKEGKEKYSAFLANSEGKTVVTVDAAWQAQDMFATLQANDYCRKLLSGAKETPYFWVDEMTNEECKCRTDCTVEINGMPLVVDLKSTNDASNEAFVRDAVRYGYDFQAAMYLEGVKAVTGVEHGFVFIAVEKTEPYSINIFQCDKPFIQHGYDTFRELLGIYSDCRKTGVWHGYLGKFNVINTLSLPAYLAKSVE